MTILFTCRKCGFQGPTLEGHRCAPPARLEQARAVLGKASERVGAAYRPPVDLPMPAYGFQELARSSGSGEASAAPLAKERSGFDRNAYHKAYMKTYMKGWRARRKAP